MRAISKRECKAAWDDLEEGKHSCHLATQYISSLQEDGVVTSV
jgi:SRSO17 transposase